MGHESQAEQTWEYAMHSPKAEHDVDRVAVSAATKEGVSSEDSGVDLMDSFDDPALTPVKFSFLRLTQTQGQDEEHWLPQRGLHAIHESQKESTQLPPSGHDSLPSTPVATTHISQPGNTLKTGGSASTAKSKPSSSGHVSNHVTGASLHAAISVLDPGSTLATDVHESGPLLVTNEPLHCSTPIKRRHATVAVISPPAPQPLATFTRTKSMPPKPTNRYAPRDIDPSSQDSFAGPPIPQDLNSFVRNSSVFNNTFIRPARDGRPLEVFERLTRTTAASISERREDILSDSLAGSDPVDDESSISQVLQASSSHHSSPMRPVRQPVVLVKDSQSQNSREGDDRSDGDAMPSHVDDGQRDNNVRSSSPSFSHQDALSHIDTGVRDSIVGGSSPSLSRLPSEPSMVPTQVNTQTTEPSVQPTQLDTQPTQTDPPLDVPTFPSVGTNLTGPSPLPVPPHRRRQIAMLQAERLSAMSSGDTPAGDVKGKGKGKGVMAGERRISAEVPDSLATPAEEADNPTKNKEAAATKNIPLEGDGDGETAEVDEVLKAVVPTATNVRAGRGRARATTAKATKGKKAATAKPKKTVKAVRVKTTTPATAKEPTVPGPSTRTRKRKGDPLAQTPRGSEAPVSSSVSPRKRPHSTRSVTAPPLSLNTRVLARRTDKDNDYLPGTVVVQTTATDPIPLTTVFTVQFDDGHEEDMDVEYMRQFQVEPEDIVYVTRRTKGKATVCLAQVLEVDRWDLSEIAEVHELGRGPDADDYDVEGRYMRVNEDHIAEQWNERRISTRTLFRDKNFDRPGPNDCLAGIGFIITLPDLPSSKRSLVEVIEVSGGVVYSDWSSIISLTGSVEVAGKRMVGKTPDMRVAKDSRKTVLKSLFCLTDEPRTTPKYLTALALGVPCLSLDWVLERVTQDDPARYVDWQAYVLPAGLNSVTRMPASQAFDRAWWRESTNIPMLLSHPPVLKPFAGKAFLCVGAYEFVFSKRDFGTFPKILLAMGASYVQAVTSIAHVKLKGPSKFDYTVVDDGEELVLYEDALAVNVSWLKKCLVTGIEGPVPWPEREVF